MPKTKLNVIIADDHKIFRVGLTTMIKSLRNVGTIRQATNGKEAVELMDADPAHVVFMDIKMPVLNGIEATRAITKKHLQTQVIAMSVYDDDKNLQDMFESGARGYLLKNTDLDEIQAAISAVTSGKVYYSKNVSDNLLQRLLPTRRITETVPGDIELTMREKEILYALWQELSTKEIAEKLNIAYKTVEMYRGNLLIKTQSRNSVALVKYALRKGIIQEMENLRR